MDRHIDRSNENKNPDRHTDRSNERNLDRYMQDRHDFRSPPERPDKPLERDRTSFDKETKAPPRQRSLPISSSGSLDQPTKSTTMPKFPSEEVKDPPYENVAVENELAVARKWFLFYISIMIFFLHFLFLYADVTDRGINGTNTEQRTLIQNSNCLKINNKALIHS